VGAVLARLPEVPFWPQLPRRTPLEGMTLQYLEGFPALAEGGAGAEPTARAAGEAMEEVAEFYERVLSGALESFSLSPERAAGFYAFEEALDRGAPSALSAVKGHVTGPVTLASSLRDAQGREVLHDDTQREVVGTFVARKAVWQARRLRRFGVPVIVFLDEPVMEVFGSAYSTLDEEAVSGLWRPSLEALHDEGALVGIHCCGNTDWALLFRSGADIVNFDACGYLDRMLLYPREAEAYLSGGGILAWGAVPTSPDARAETEATVAGRVEEGIRRFAAQGLDEGTLRRQCLVTPACGMGSLDPGLAERILDLLAGGARRLRGG
jgi:methionine synthase II (cobalamin-independent)